MGANGNFESRFSSLDYVCLGIYFVGVMVVALVAMCRINRATENGYFLAGRFMTWLPVGASLFASNIGSEHFIGLAGSGAAAGIAVGAFEFNAGILLQLLGWVFLPVYIASRVTTLPEYMVKRFAGQRICLYLSLLSLTLYVFTKISVNLYSGIIFIQEGLGWGQWFALLLLLAVAGFCTVTGGLGAVIYTDTLQTFIMVIGATIVAILAFIRVGGYNSLVALYPQAIPSGAAAASGNASQHCNMPKHNAFRMLRGLGDSEMPWLGFVLGQTPASIWYWAADQMMVQRTLAAKSLSHAQGGCVFASFLKLLPLFIMVLPGMISRVLEPDIIACANPDYCEQVCGNRLGCSNLAYPRLVLNLLPQGARGLMLAVMLSALMSDLTSIFNSAATLFTMDIYTKIRRSAERYELMVVGRSFVIVMVVVSVLWIPVISSMQGGQMYIYIQSIAAYLSPQIAAVYLCAVLWPRCNEKGAFWALMISTCVGFGRMATDFFYTAPACGYEDERPWFVTDMHYMYIAMVLFWLTIFLCVGISLATAPLPEYQLIRTTFVTRFDSRPRPDEVRNNNSSSVFSGGNVALEPLGKNGALRPPVLTVFHPSDNKTNDADELKTENGMTNQNNGLMPIIYETCESPASQLELTADEQAETTKRLLTPSPVLQTELRDSSTIDTIERHDDATNVVLTSPPQSRRFGVVRYLRRAVNWFCGLDASEQDIAREQVHVSAIATLEQDPRALMLLNVLLVLLIIITIFVYGYFSFIPPFIHSRPLDDGGQQSIALLEQ